MHRAFSNARRPWARQAAPLRTIPESVILRSPDALHRDDEESAVMKGIDLQVLGRVYPERKLRTLRCAQSDRARKVQDDMGRDVLQHPVAP